jgi:ATP-dependent exoDNAse (exonuclease V) beta subunit
LIECHFHNWEPDLSEYAPDDIERAHVAFRNFKTFWDEQELTVLEPEVQLVSEQYLFGGTIDAPSVDKQGRIVLLDWKTSQRHLACRTAATRRVREALE